MVWARAELLDPQNGPVNSGGPSICHQVSVQYQWYALDYVEAAPFDRLDLWRYDGVDSAVRIAAPNVSPDGQPGDAIGLGTDGDDIVVYFRDAEVARVTDTTYRGPLAGVASASAFDFASAPIRLDNWTAGSGSYGDPAEASDDFNRANQLLSSSPDWQSSGKHDRCQVLNNACDSTGQNGGHACTWVTPFGPPTPAGAAWLPVILQPARF